MLKKCLTPPSPLNQQRQNAEFERLRREQERQLRLQQIEAQAAREREEARRQQEAAAAAAAAEAQREARRQQEIAELQRQQLADEVAAQAAALALQQAQDRQRLEEALTGSRAGSVRSHRTRSHRSRRPSLQSMLGGRRSLAGSISTLSIMNVGNILSGGTPSVAASILEREEILQPVQHQQLPEPAQPANLPGAPNRHLLEPVDNVLPIPQDDAVHDEPGDDPPIEQPIGDLPPPRNQQQNVEAVVPPPAAEPVPLNLVVNEQANLLAENAQPVQPVMINDHLQPLINQI